MLLNSSVSPYPGILPSNPIAHYSNNTLQTDMCRHKKPLDTPRYKPKKTPKKMKRWPNKPPKTTVSLNTRKRRIRLVTMLKGMFLSKQMEELTDRYLHLAPTPFLSRLRWWKVLSSLLDVDKRLRSHRSITSRAPMSKLYRTTHWMEGKKKKTKKGTALQTQ